MCSLISPSFLFPTSLCLPLVSQLSIRHPQPVPTPSKGSLFQNGGFLFNFFVSPIMLPEFVSGKRNSYLHVRRDTQGWKDLHKPVHLSFISQPLYLGWNSEPHQWLCMAKVVYGTFLMSLCLSDFQHFLPNLQLPFCSLNNRNCCYNRFSNTCWESSSSCAWRAFPFDSSCLFFPQHWTMSLSLHPRNLIWMDILAQLRGPVSICEQSPSANGDHCSNEHTPCALMHGLCYPAEHMPHRQCVLGDPSCWRTEICFWLGFL